MDDTDRILLTDRHVFGIGGRHRDLDPDGGGHKHFDRNDCDRWGDGGDICAHKHDKLLVVTNLFL
jgi:hypothetical protein